MIKAKHISNREKQKEGMYVLSHPHGTVYTLVYILPDFQYNLRHNLFAILLGLSLLFKLHTEP